MIQKYYFFKNNERHLNTHCQINLKSSTNILQLLKSSFSEKILQNQMMPASYQWSAGHSFSKMYVRHAQSCRSVRRLSTCVKSALKPHTKALVTTVGSGTTLAATWRHPFLVPQLSLECVNSPPPLSDECRLVPSYRHH